MAYNTDWEYVRAQGYQVGGGYVGISAWSTTVNKEYVVTGTGASMTTWNSENENLGNGSSVRLVQIKANDWFKEYRRRGTSGVPANLTTDGIFGSKSKTAVVWLQNRWDITADGKVGSVTWSKLKLG